MFFLPLGDYRFSRFLGKLGEPEKGNSKGNLASSGSPGFWPENWENLGKTIPRGIWKPQVLPVLARNWENLKRQIWLGKMVFSSSPGLFWDGEGNWENLRKEILRGIWKAQVLPVWARNWENLRGGV